MGTNKHPNYPTVWGKANEPIIETVADAVCRLEERWQRLSVGCIKLDGFLQGGVATQGITEIAGESGSGKTQLCLQLALTVQYPVSCGGLNGGRFILLSFKVLN
jgi:RecA/RadA recombinase